MIFKILFQALLMMLAETQTTYIWLNNRPLAQISADGSIYYYQTDHLGTPQKMTDQSGTVVWAADYLPFGKADVTIETLENNLRFMGQYYDWKTGLHYNWHRYYDPVTGRYLRADPIGLEGGINLYAYVENDPVNLIDPYGLKDWGKIIGGGAIVAFSVVEAGVGGALIGVGIVEMPAGAAVGPEGLAISIPVGIHTMGLGGLVWGNAAFVGNIGAEIFIEGWDEGKDDPCNDK